MENNNQDALKLLMEEERIKFQQEEKEVKPILDELSGIYMAKITYNHITETDYWFDIYLPDFFTPIPLRVDKKTGDLYEDGDQLYCRLECFGGK